jgi:hypothetical protein
MQKRKTQQHRRRSSRRVLQQGGRISGPVFRGDQFVVRRPNDMAAMHHFPMQRGRGLGSFLAGLFRTAMPLIKSAGKAVGKQALSTGLDVARDLAFDPETRKAPKQMLKRRMKEAGDILQEKFKEKVSRMTGSGRAGSRKRKRAPSKRRKQSGGRITKRKTGKRRRLLGGQLVSRNPSDIALAIRRALGARQRRKKVGGAKKGRKKKRGTVASTTGRSATDVFS